MSAHNDNPVDNKPFAWCARLRWKSHPLDQVDASRVEASFARGGFTYTCLSTVQAFGPDDGPVAPEACTSGRGCFRAHPNSRLPQV